MWENVGQRDRLLAQLYDWEHDDFRDDLALYRALARRTGGPALELACGSGRAMSALAAAGLDVVGLDCSDAMLDRARARLAPLGSRSTLVRGDLNGELPAGGFALIALPLDGFGFATGTDAQIALLRRIAGALTERGLLVLDLVSVGSLDGQPQGIPVLQRSGHSPEIGAHVTKWVVRRISPVAQTIELSCFYDLTWSDGATKRYVEVVSLRYFSRYEVELLLAAGGLRLEGIYGDYDLGPFCDESDRLIVLACRT